MKVLKGMGVTVLVMAGAAAAFAAGRRLDQHFGSPVANKLRELRSPLEAGRPDVLR